MGTSIYDLPNMVAVILSHQYLVRMYLSYKSMYCTQNSSFQPNIHELWCLSVVRGFRLREFECWDMLYTFGVLYLTVCAWCWWFCTACQSSSWSWHGHSDAHFGRIVACWSWRLISWSWWVIWRPRWIERRSLWFICRHWSGWRLVPAWYGRLVIRESTARCRWITAIWSAAIWLKNISDSIDRHYAW